MIFGGLKSTLSRKDRLCIHYCYAFLQTLPLVVGVAVVAVSAILIKLFVLDKKEKKALKTLQDPNVKYPLELVDKEVIETFCRPTLSWQCTVSVVTLILGAKLSDCLIYICHIVSKLS